MLTGNRAGCFDESKTQHHTSHSSDAVTGLARHATQAHEVLRDMERPEALNLVYSVNMETVLLPLPEKWAL